MERLELEQPEVQGEVRGASQGNPTGFPQQIDDRGDHMAARQTGLAIAMGGMFVLALASGGCAMLRAGAAQQKYINEQTTQHVYQMPITQVWPNVRTMLFAEGYKTKSSDTGGSYSLETEPKMDGDKTVTYLVQGTKVDDNSCKVEFTKNVQGSIGTTSNRDPQMEWHLLQKVDPPAAQKIKADADAEGEKAKKAQS